MSDDSSSSAAPDSAGGAPPPPPDASATRPGATDDAPPPPPPGPGPGAGSGSLLTAPHPDPSGAGSGPGDPAAPNGTDDGGPAGPVGAEGSPRGGLAAGLVPVGSGLLGAAVLLSALRARDGDGGLDWSTYGVGLGATAVLLVASVVGVVVAGRRVGGKARSDVVTWPGVVGVLAVAPMVEVGLDSDERWVGYLIGGLIAGLAVVGYVLSRRAAFVVTALVGIGLVYALLFDDLLADAFDDENSVVVIAAAVTVFVLAATLLGSLLPTRNVSNVAVGAAGVVGLVALMASLLVMRLASEFFGGLLGGLGEQVDLGDSEGLLGPDQPGMGEMRPGGGFAESDVWWVLAFAAVLTLVWAACAVASNHSGFSILAIVMPAIIVPLAAAALAVEQPTWWSAVLAAVGGVLLLAAAALARRRGSASVGPAR